MQVGVGFTNNMQLQLPSLTRSGPAHAGTVGVTDAAVNGNLRKGTPLTTAHSNAATSLQLLGTGIVVHYSNLLYANVLVNAVCVCVSHLKCVSPALRILIEVVQQVSPVLL